MLDIKKSNSVVANQLKKIFSGKGIKQSTIAANSGFTAQELSDMLNGRRLIRVVDIEAILNTLQKYQVDANELFGIAKEKKEGISINGKQIKEILVLADCDELVASITEKNVIEKDGYKVVSVPNID